MNKKLALLLLICIVSLIGCAFGTRRPTLTYTSVAAEQSSKNIKICLMPFNDKRTVTDTIGYSRNAYGMRCAKVIPTNNVADWVTQAMRTELEKAGYSVSCGEGASNVIEGDIYEVFCDAYMSYEGRLGLRVVLKKSGETILDRSYSSKQNGGINWAATETAYATTLELTLRDTIMQVLRDMNNNGSSLTPLGNAVSPTIKTQAASKCAGVVGGSEWTACMGLK